MDKPILKKISGFWLSVTFVVVILGGYSFLVLQYHRHYEKRPMPARLQQFEEMGVRIAAFYKSNGRFPSNAKELDAKSIALLSDSTSGITINFQSQRLTYNFERDDFDLYGSPLHVISVGLFPANRVFAIEYDIITIKNKAENLSGMNELAAPPSVAP